MITDYIRFSRRSYPLLLFGLITVFWGNFGQSFFISWFGASFQESLSLSATSYGTLYSMATLASGLLLMFAGAQIDRFALHWFVAFSSLGLLIATLILWQVNSATELMVGLFMLRLFGQGLLPHTGITTMTRMFVYNRGKAVSIATCGVPLGEILLPTVAVFLIAVCGWQKSWLIIGISVPLMYLPCAVWLLKKGSNERYREMQDTQKTHAKSIQPEMGSRRTLLCDSRFWRALPAILALPFIVTGLFIHQGTILPQMEWTPALFARCFVFYGLFHWLSSLYTGGLVDRFSGAQLFKYFLLPLLAALTIPAFFSGKLSAYSLMILLGVSIGSSNPIINSLWAEVYGTEHLGSIRAMISSLAVLSTSVSPILFGVLIDGGVSGSQLFIGLTVFTLIAISLSLFSYQTNKSLV